jgi:hypothetical protein
MMNISKSVAYTLVLSTLLSLSSPLWVMADGLVQLRPISSSSPTVANTGNTVQPWQPSRIDMNDSSNSQYRTGVSAIEGKQFLTIRLNDRVSSQDTKVGDTVSATLESPLMSGSAIVAPAGSEVLGSVVDVSTAKRAGVHGEVDLRFYTIVKPNGERVAMDAIVVTKHGGSQIRSNNYVVDAARGVGIAAAGTAGGAIAGTATGAVFSAAGPGAALGTAIGATAGVGYALWRKGKAVELPKGTLLQLQTRDAQSAARPI